MKLLTKELERRFAELGCQDGKGFDATVVARYFHPGASWTWYATEYEPDTRLFFGYVTGFADEWGSFSLDEMESIEGALGLGVERDLYFREKPLREALAADGRAVPVYARSDQGDGA